MIARYTEGILLRLPINTPTFTLLITTIYFNVVITSKK